MSQPNPCCIETYKKCMRLNELSDHIEGSGNLLEDEENTLGNEYEESTKWIKGLYKEWSAQDVPLRPIIRDKITRWALLRAHFNGEINLLGDKQRELQAELSDLTSWMQSFPED